MIKCHDPKSDWTELTWDVLFLWQWEDFSFQKGGNTGHHREDKCMRQRPSSQVQERGTMCIAKGILLLYRQFEVILTSTNSFRTGWRERNPSTCPAQWESRKWWPGREGGWNQQHQHLGRSMASRTAGRAGRSRMTWRSFRWRDKSNRGRAIQRTRGRQKVREWS